MNLRTRAITQYHSFSPFAMAVFNEQAIIADEAGLHFFGYQHGNDNGKIIKAYARFVAMDFGVQVHKAVSGCHLSAITDGSLSIIWQADTEEWVDGSVQQATQELVAVQSSVAYRDLKGKGHRKIVGTYFEFQIANINGDDFTLNEFTVDLISKSGGESV